jgi:2-polyprenyl-3-methyl-5-hydroxy-6-metoxy-1,4-benzoquinol methylase
MSIDDSSSFAHHRMLGTPFAVADLSAQDAFFDELAESFAQRYLSHRAFRDRKALFVEEARIVHARSADGKPLHCLDLGCGPGIIAGAISDVGFKVTAIDRSEKMVKVAERLAARRTLSRGRIEFARADVTEFVSATRERFSLVISSSVFEYLSNPLEVIELAASHLDPGGTLAFSIPNFDSVLRSIEPWIQGVLPDSSRYRKFWGNELNATDYIAAAFDMGLSLEKARTFGLPTLSNVAFGSLLANGLFETMTLLVFRRV